MKDIYLSNTLSRKKEKFIPVKEGFVGIYSCGPTVYWNQHIGHMYAYVQWDTLVRFLRYIGYEVKWVMNITDVGHMTSDEDTGEDKMEKGAKREGVSVWDLADRYIKQFKDSMSLLNITSPDVLPRATKHIVDQVNLIKLIEKNKFTYQTQMGVVYDTSKFPDYAKFGQLDLDSQKPRQDVEEDKEKKRPWDFLLWVTGNIKHIMQWDSPWGKGYPGWHIECTAMSTKYLGNNFDIHTGGIEHIAVHHTNEIAQGFAAFGKQTANYWLHNGWLTGSEGEKMSKSLGNYVTAQELVEKGYNPLALRYLIYSSHYKRGLQFSWQALDAATAALDKLKNAVTGLKESEKEREELSAEKMKKIDEYRDKFVSALSDDINIPVALSVLWEVVKSNIPASDKYDLVLSFDEVLGLKLVKTNIGLVIPKEVRNLVAKRENIRKAGNYEEADKLRMEIEKKGYSVKDTPQGSEVKPIQ
ncbi:cysteine--tRNA ligase [Candidatus Woesebacteria bacterium RBG_16_36_11]|uniref:Cysteine--tRNA ligase n=3 Tax=Candidatus Woeseibacteriota TaxID=1752722 RepID=A0A1F7XBR3_9BACT|nr:MAG: cysteine--tRNA ligase [Candidatus Woesebacteria bacterium RBG_13_36_22]OGM12474.1 MAG: cysteine--tRNA ligase [Candidatus Woesebacteria bacterium RBG_16_36_11]OGM17355.1 MAG: cysteine--tRNA ligase [Candidatus Woesebacteria bacterium RBG_19FT_COMBO_37_29]